jgi:uncharacterized protein
VFYLPDERTVSGQGNLNPFLSGGWSVEIDFNLTGFYPRIYDLALNPTNWLLDYIKTYVERDLRQILNVSDLGRFQQFLEICADL